MHKNSDIVKKYEKFQDLVDCERQLFEPNPNFMEELNNIRIEDNESDEDEEQMEQEEEETVTNKEFQNMLKTKTYNGDKTYRMQDRKNLNNKINTLNKEQRKIFDEMLDIREDKQTFLYLYGKAGTGKTYLLNTIIPALEFKSLKSGIDLNKPLVLVMSPTAAAAKHLLYGDTIHGSLRLTSFQNLEQQMVHGANAKLSSEFCQLKYVIIDEISMVGSEFLWDINQRLKQIMGSEKYFGGLNVIATGDFHQLAPIKKSWIFQQTKIHGRANNTATNLWKVLFKMYKLVEHNRSAKDLLYSELQENIAIGIVTDSMMLELQKRVKAVCETENCNDWYRDGKQIMITATHDIKDKFNINQLNLLQGDMIKIQATDISSKHNEDLPDFNNLTENKTKGLISILHIKQQCPIILTININKKDSLVNGTFGYVLDYDKKEQIIWCIFR